MNDVVPVPLFFLVPRGHVRMNGALLTCFQARSSITSFAKQGTAMHAVLLCDVVSCTRPNAANSNLDFTAAGQLLHATISGQTVFTPTICCVVWLYVSYPNVCIISFGYRRGRSLMKASYLFKLVYFNKHFFRTCVLVRVSPSFQPTNSFACPATDQ